MEKKPVGRPRKYKKGQHPNSKNAIKKYEWKPEQSGNPEGKGLNKVKAKPPLEDVLNEVGHEETSITTPGKKKKVVTKYYAFSHNLFKNAIAGKSPAVKELLERLYGKSPDFINLNVTEKPKYTGKGSPEKYIHDMLSGNKKAEA